VISVLVLAAGAARRFGGRTKTLLQLPGPDGPETVLDRHRRLWLDAGADRVVVVTSPSLAESFRPYARDGVELVVADGASAGSALSLRCGLQALSDSPSARADQGIVVLDGDTVYEPDLPRHVLAEPFRTALFATPASGGDDEEVRVYARPDGRPALLGKAVSEDVARGLRLLGESLGVVALAPADVPRAEAVLHWMVGSPPDWAARVSSGQRTEHEDLWQCLFALDALAVAQLPESVLFSEFDTEIEYEAVLRDLLPAIRGKAQRPDGHW
jgi:CTP:molybdopterin cytidylyltransferase MocA